jgi:hypothetical protein
MAPVKWGAPLRPDEVAEAVAYVTDHRETETPFDVVVSGSTGPAHGDADRMAAYVGAGATWWLEDISPWRFGADPQAQWTDRDTRAIERRVAAGPPRHA